MIIKIVTLFLVFMAVLAMFGRLRLPKLPKINTRQGLPKPRRCSKCGHYNVKGGPCPHCDEGRG